jgi:raffinose/stachyose/melibiose transport system permease protein
MKEQSVLKTAASVPRKSLNRKTKIHINAYLFLIPVFLTMGLFKYYPFLTAISKSFYDWNGSNLNDFVGFENYVKLLKDEEFLRSMRNIVFITVSYVIFQLTFPLIAAVGVFHFINKKMQGLYKTMFIVPMVVPSVIIVLLWKWIYLGEGGMLNQFLITIGLPSLAHQWLGDSSTALAAIIFMNFPWIGTISFLLYLGGLVSISPDLFESGKLEGMNSWQRLIHIEIPLIKNQIRLVIILAFIHHFQSFENVLLLTSGGPGYSTITPALHLYKQGFEYNSFGYASSIGVIVFLILVVFTILTNIFLKPADKID